MQIGSGSNYLPGCAPTPKGVPSTTPPTPAPMAPEPPPVRAGRRHRTTVALLLVVGAVLVAVAGAFFVRGREWNRAGIASATDGVKRFFTRMAGYLPGTGATATNQGVVLTPAQQRLVAEYSPVRPINETKRVKELERSRVAEPNPDDRARVGGAAIRPVAMGVTSTPAVVSEPAAATTEKSRTSRPPVAAPVAEKPFVWPAINVTAAIGDRQSKWIARVNGRLVTVGDTIDGALVVAISTQRVTLACNGQQRDFFMGAGR